MLYVGDKDMTDMAVIEVELVTGWEAYNPDYLLNEVRDLQYFIRIRLNIFLFWTFQNLRNKKYRIESVSLENLYQDLII